MKNRTLKKLMVVLLMMVLVYGISACSDSDEEEGKEQTAEDEKEDNVSEGEGDYTRLMEIKSPDKKMVVILLSDENNQCFYKVSNDGEVVIEPSKLGLVTTDADFSTGALYTEGKVSEITDEYELLNGKHNGTITDTCNEYTFTLTKDGKKLTVNIRVYDDGVAYNYAMDEGATVKGEASESVFSDDAVVWSYQQPNVTYEGTYTKSSMKVVKNMAATYTTPSLVETGNNYVLLTESSKFDDEENYCSSVLKTVRGSKKLGWTFGNGQSSSVVMNKAFETPWRVAIIANDLNVLVNSDIVTSVCEDVYDVDYSFVKPGKLAWSWWSSTGDNPIAFEPQFDYIDFASKNGWEYVCLDYGWVLWDDYKDKVKELVDYAAERNVGIWLWYGVNNVGHSGTGAYPKYSLLNEETIRTEMEWAQSIGIKGVKVDYYEKDNQTTMNQMYLCAKISAEHELMVLFHGCTNPGGENRTFPNVLSYEAVYGAEYYKWRTEPSAANIITYLFTRNVVGSADFTPTALPVAGISATHGFMLGTAIYVESGLVHFAENVNVYEGYTGLSLMNDLPVTWDETVVLEGNPGAYGTVARRSENDWYMASLTTAARTVEVKLSFLEDGKTYNVYLYKTNEAGDNIEVEVIKATSEDTLKVELGADDGFSAKITENEFDYVTDYEKNYTYIEGEDGTRKGAAALSTNAFNAQYSSGKQATEYIGNGADNNVTFTVNTENEGVYELNIFYISGNNRRFMVSVNGDEADRIRTGRLNSGDWVTVKKEPIYVRLKAGENTIKFYNDKAFAPNLDRISISKSPVNMSVTVSDEEEDVIEVSPGAEYEYTMYEAEKAKLGNGATNEGTFAGWLGGTAYVEFDNIEAEAAGKYYMVIWYMSGEDRDVYVSVNGEADIIKKCPSSGDYNSNPSCVYAEVELKAGANTIKITQPKGYAPNIDRMGISTTSVVK